MRVPWNRCENGARGGLSPYETSFPGKTGCSFPQRQRWLGTSPRPGDNDRCALFPNSCSCRKCLIPDRGVAPGQQGHWCFCLPLSFNDLGESHLWALCPSDRSAEQKMPLFSGTAGLGAGGPSPSPHRPTPTSGAQGSGFQLPSCSSCLSPESRCREAGLGRARRPQFYQSTCREKEGTPAVEAPRHPRSPQTLSFTVSSRTRGSPSPSSLKGFGLQVQLTHCPGSRARAQGGGWGAFGVPGPPPSSHRPGLVVPAAASPRPSISTPDGAPGASGKAQDPGVRGWGPGPGAGAGPQRAKLSCVLPGKSDPGGRGPGSAARALGCMTLRDGV